MSREDSLDPPKEEAGKLEPLERNLLLGLDLPLLSGEDEMYDGRGD